MISLEKDAGAPEGHEPDGRQLDLGVWEGQNAYHYWARAYLDVVEHAPFQPRRDMDRSVVDHVVAVLLCGVARADGNLSSGEIRVIGAVLAKSEGLTTQFFERLHETARRSPEFHERMEDLIVSATSLEIAGLMPGQPHFLQMLEHLGRMLVGVEGPGHRARLEALSRTIWRLRPYVEWTRTEMGQG